MSNIEEDIKILNNLKGYLNKLIYEGQHKIFYNDLGYDEKTIDCINVLEHILAERKQDKARIQELQDMLKEKDELYHKALGDLVKADREIIQLNRQIDLMAEQIKIPEPTMKIESFDIKPKTKFGMRYLNKEEVKQYFERKAEE